MTILPGSLDYLYYNGILERIPYEAYEMIPASPGGMQQNDLSAELQAVRNLKQSGFNNSGMNGAGMSSISMHGSNYLNTAKKGDLYGSYGNFNDSYYGTTNYQQVGMQPQAKMYGGSKSRRLRRNSRRGNGLAYKESGNTYNKYDRQLRKNGGYDFRSSLGTETTDTKEGVLNSHPGAKGLLAALIIVATPILFFKRLIKPKAAKAVVPSKTKGRRRSGKNNSATPPSTPKSTKSFWQKINPFNWFKSGKK
jgi:hypothetical protein